MGLRTSPLIDLKLAIRCYVAAAVPLAAMPDSFPPARAWNESARWTLPSPFERAAAHRCIPTFLFDISALRGNRWIRKGAGARVRKKVDPEN
jgi:hypothetical protein